MAASPRRLAIAMGQEIAYDEMGNVKTGTLMDFFPAHRMGERPTTSPITRRPPPRIIRSGRRVWAKAPMSAACPAFSNAVHDAFPGPSA